MRWNLISMRRVIFRWLNLVVEYINADEKIHFCLYLMNKMRTNFINAIMQVLFPVAFIVLHCFFSSSGSLILDAQIVSTKAKLALSSFLLLTILPSYFSTFLVSLHNHLYHISIVLSPTPLPPPHLYCFPMHLYHHHICIVFPLATTTTTFVLFSHPPLQPPYLYRFPIHHICIVVQSTLTTFLLFARNRQSPILIKYGQPLFVWLSRDWPSARTYASTDCKGGVGKTIKRERGVSQACLGKSTSCILDIHKMVNWQLSKQDSHWPVSHDHIAGSCVNSSRWHDLFGSCPLTS